MGKTSKKRIIVSVTNDLVSDNRVHKVCTTLHHAGFSVLLVGRILPRSLSLASRSYDTRRFRLLFRKGPLFYLCFNLRLLFFLLFSKADVLLANDLDALPANFLASRAKRCPLVYDSHELFPEVPELVDRPRIKRIWEWLERKMVPGLAHAFTVSESIARYYREKYGTSFRVVRNVPRARSFAPERKEERTGAEKIVLYQGAVNVHRGLENAIRAMKFLEGVRLVIAGDGNLKASLMRLTENEGVQQKVRFLGRLPVEDLIRLTPCADLGISLEEDVGLNYRYALPNKLFDYIQAQVPVLVSALPEMAAVVNHYQIGKVIDSRGPEELARTIGDMLSDVSRRDQWERNLKKAAELFIWEREEKVLQDIFRPFL